MEAEGNFYIMAQHIFDSDKGRNMLRMWMLGGPGGDGIEREREAGKQAIQG